MGSVCTSAKKKKTKKYTQNIITTNCLTFIGDKPQKINQQNNINNSNINQQIQNIKEENSENIISNNNNNNIINNPNNINNINNNINNEVLNLSVNEEFPSDSNRKIPLNPHNFSNSNVDRINNQNELNNLNIQNNINNNNNINNIYNNNINNNNNLNESNDDSLTDRNEHYCKICHQSFPSIREFQMHLPLCNEMQMQRNIRIHNSLNEIIHMVHDFNQQLSNRNNNVISLLSLDDEIQESNEYIDWVFNEKNRVWINNGKIYLNKNYLKKISKIPKSEIVKEKFYIKRIWFTKYINDNIYDKSNDNSPLVISRDNILEESYNQFMTDNDLNLKRNVHIFFIDEVARDVGGVYREWYSSLFNEIFSKKFSFFIEINYNSFAKGSFFLPVQNPIKFNNDYLSYYKFIGKIIGKALFDKITLNYNINPIILKHLITKDNPKFTLEDLKYYDIELYNSLNSILNSNMNINDDLFFTWQINGKEINLIRNGCSILINNDNKKLFVEKVINLICYESIKEKLIKLKEGFNSLNFDINSKEHILNIFSIEEFDFLLSGQTKIDLEDWKKNTIYKGYYNELYPTIENFWEVLKELKQEELLIFYKFCTGCSRIPIDGFGSLQGTRNKLMKFCIESPSMKDKICNHNRLIEAKTCFNRIILPEYENKEKMKNAIYTIIHNDTNFFGLE